MRPCCHCRAAIENSAAACPQCGTAQDAGPKANTETAPPHRGIARRLLADLVELTGFAPAVALTLLTLPLAVGGLIGYAIGDANGAVVGVGVAIALMTGVAIWAEAGG